MDKARVTFLKSLKTEILQMLKGSLKPVTESWQVIQRQ